MERRKLPSEFSVRYSRLRYTYVPWIEHPWVFVPRSFTIAHVKELSIKFRLPAVVITRGRYRCHAIEALCITLRRLATTHRFVDMIPMFGRSQSALCDIFSWTLKYLYENLAMKVLVWDKHRLTHEFMRRCAATVRRKGAAMRNIFAFIDGTVRPMCRPSTMQRFVYNGHKRCHALKFQSVLSPDGLIISLAGPWLGKVHDVRMLRESGLPELLRHFCVCPDGTAFALYGDPAYGDTIFIFAPFKGTSLTREQQAFNTSMSKVRTCVEWGFGKWSLLCR